MKTSTQPICFSLTRSSHLLIRPLHLLYLVLLVSYNAAACNVSEMRKYAFQLMEKDDYEVIVAKLKAGDPLDPEDRAIYQSYYKRALRKALQPVEDRFEDLMDFGTGEVEAMDIINRLDDPASAPIPIVQNKGHPYPSYRQAVDTVRLHKYNTIKINGVELSEYAKQVITDIPDEIYLKNNRDFIRDYYEKSGMDTDEINRLMRSISIEGDGLDLPLIDAQTLYHECLSMEDGQNALIQLHRLDDNERSDIVQRTVSEPTVMHYHDGDYYLIDLNRYKVEVGEVRVFSKDTFLTPETSPHYPLDAAHKKIFKEAITEDYIALITYYKMEIDRINNTGLIPFNPQIMNRLEVINEILKRAGLSAPEYDIQLEGLFYTIFTRW